jgi:arsenate reductase (thioredoxin)
MQTTDSEDQVGHGRRKLNVLFLCTGNSCRSQMAEGFARHLRADGIKAYSAGVDPHGMNPRAIAAMAEAGIDISAAAGYRSKHVNELMSVPFDFVVTVCGHAAETCPTFPGKATVVHIGFDDPPKLARDAAAVTDEQAMPHYRRVRDEIRHFIENFEDSVAARA